MSEAVENVILLPRFSAFAGATTFYTAPMNVRDYSQAILQYVHSGAIGAIGPTVNVFVEESPDLEIWNEIGSSLNTGLMETRDFAYEWIRMKLVVSGSDQKLVAFTCWCVGGFVLRHT
jgi:hypothetical protein